MTELIAMLPEVVQKALRLWTSPVYLARIGAVALAMLIWWVARWRRRDRPVSRFDVFTDALWAAFYLSGVYSILIATPYFALLTSVIHRFVPFLEFRLLSEAPFLVQYLVTSLAVDLGDYCWHRLAHRTTFLWSFHRVHHSQTELTPLTNVRSHVADLLARGIFSAAIGAILNPTAGAFLLAVWTESLLSSLAHADVGWTYGYVGRVLVSPQFHRLHHAADLETGNRNFGLMYSLWDRLFGTADLRASRPAAYGLVNDQAPRDVVRQTFEPFAYLFRAYAPRRPAPPEAIGDVGA